MSQVAVIGCGAVGAAIAYELSLVPGLEITVFDRHSPAQGATAASLGVLMGAISQKVKGRNWQLRYASMQRYETLIPELEALTGCQIPFNRQGILMLCFQEEEMKGWHQLAEIRRNQGFQLEILQPSEVVSRCPQLECSHLVGGVYSPQDRQVDPVALTQALVAGAERNGVSFQFGVAVEGFEIATTPDCRCVCQVKTVGGGVSADWVVIAAGLGSAQLTENLAQPADIRPVLGQGMRMRLELPLGNPDFQPVITGDDAHIVPVGGGDYWVGATVEFPAGGGEPVADAKLLDAVMEKIISFCPILAEATVIEKWSGLRPRPEKQAAPVIGRLPGYSNVLLATGHYRNGILLAPATAQAIRQLITAHS
jgi:glycine/D-amino acid oxidase-like deaminating enzyme